MNFAETFKKFFGHYFQIFFLSTVCVEFLSFLSFLFPPVKIIIFTFLVAGIFILALKRLDIAVLIVLAELVIGSKGYLFSLDIGHMSFSIRLGLFLAVMLAWFIRVLQNREILFLKTRFWKPYMILIFFIVLGLVTGLLRGNAISTLFFDINGYLFFGLVFPFFESIRTKKDIFHLFEVLLAATTASILKSLFLLFVFAQQFTIFLPNIYKWIRVSGVGEITQFQDAFYRIFFQSHIYEVILFFLLLPLLFFTPAQQRKNSGFVSVFFRWALAFLIIFISYSRSFWLGTVMTLVLVYVLCAAWWKVGMRKLAILTLVLIATFAVDYGLTFALISLPLPNRSFSLSASSLITDRTEDVTEESAGASRFQLLQPLTEKALEHPFLGSGFGTTVTYKTEDPRALANNPDGYYTTYAFEWGYLDLWVKMGIFGLLAYVAFIGYILFTAKPFFRNIQHPENTLVVGSCIALVSVALIHATTPYLNHPIGISWIIVTMGVIHILKNDMTAHRYVSEETAPGRLAKS